MAKTLDKNALRNLARNTASNAKGAWAQLDYAPLAVGVPCDYTDDVFGLTIGPNALPIVSLDPAQDTPDTRKTRHALRLRVLGNLARNARNAHDNDKVKLALYWADVPSPTKDDKDAVRRAFVVERTV
jgi:hypothetical protein